ncbi:MAG: DNA/RNA non-specific endonuclease, partial [Flavobacteriaceae bacterium]|nr:DNA/RNA non-specific endonuclease [Flavobacteriaceae bacterium]
EAETNSHFLPASTTNQVVHHDYYSLSYHEEYEQAEWVAYELKKNHLSRNDHNRPYFEIDKTVKTEAAHWRNYKNSGYSRGHLCPAGDRRFSKDAYDETFLTSNISPQKQDFNAGIWNTLEQKVRYWAAKYDGVYVVTGGVLTKGLKTIGQEEVAVPEYFYKIVLDNQNGDMKAIAFLMPHENSEKALFKFVVSVDKIEKLTGIDFFPNLEDTKEDQIEASSDYKDWLF